jgi:hypothetical protein
MRYFTKLGGVALLALALSAGCGEGIRRAQTVAMRCSNNALQSCLNNVECGSGNTCVSPYEVGGVSGVDPAGPGWYCRTNTTTTSTACKVDSDCSSGQYCASNTGGANRSNMAVAAGPYEIVEIAGKKVGVMDRASQSGWAAGTEVLYDLAMFTGCSNGLTNQSDVIYDPWTSRWYLFNTETASDAGVYGNLCVAVNNSSSFTAPDEGWVAFKYPLPFAATKACSTSTGVSCASNGDCPSGESCTAPSSAAIKAQLPTYAAEMRAAVGYDKILMSGVLSNGQLGGDTQLSSDRSMILAVSKEDLANGYLCGTQASGCMGTCIANPTTLCDISGSHNCPSGDSCLYENPASVSTPVQWSQYIYRLPFYNAFTPAVDAAHRWVMVPVKNEGHATPSTNDMFLFGLDRLAAKVRIGQREIKVHDVPPNATISYDEQGNNPWASPGTLDPPDAGQKRDNNEPARLVGTFEGRVASVKSNGGCAAAVWAGACVLSGDGTNVHSCIYWETFSGLNSSPALMTPVDHGILATAGADYYAPGVSIQGGCDQLLITANRSSASEYISTWITGRYWNDTAGTLQGLARIWPVNYPTNLDPTGATYKSISETEHSSISGYSEPWGPYSQVTFDPTGNYDAGINTTADKTFFVATQYPLPLSGFPNGTTTFFTPEWSTRVIQLSN